MYVTCENKCFKLTNGTSSEVETLFTMQGGADKCMLLHAKRTAEKSSSIVITSKDKDVLIISLSVAHNFACQMYIKSGTQNRERFVDVQKVAAAVGQDMCSALSGMHSFTGCDTVSTFGGKVKIGALKLMQKYQDTFTQLGKEWSMPRNLFNMLQEFTCKLCANRCPSTIVNEVPVVQSKERRGRIRTATSL